MRISLWLLGLWMLVFAWPCVAGLNVTIAPDGMLEVDGQRLFVLGLYENPGDDSVLAEVARAGFNLVRASQSQESLDRLHRHNLYGWLMTGGSIALRDESEESAQPLREMVSAWADHPAVLVWEVPDEALWTCMLDAFATEGSWLERAALFDQNARELAARMTAGYQLLRQIDPKHPVWMNHAAGNSLEHLTMMGHGADIAGCDIYPLMPYPTQPLDISRSGLAFVGMATTRMQASVPGKPVWMVLQGMGWGDFDNPVFTLQARPSQQPTFKESRFMAYNAIVRGARAVLYWGTHIIGKDTEMWRDLLALVRELADRQALLSAPDSALDAVIDTWLFNYLKAPSKLSPLGVQALGKVVEGETWWIVVNEFFFPVAYTLHGLETLEGTVYTEMDEGIRLTVKDGALNGRLDRYGVHILRPVP